MSNDLVSRQEAIAIMCKALHYNYEEGYAVTKMMALPSAQLETSRIENILHGKSAEEQYDFLRWLMQDYGMQFTDTRVAVIEWLRGENDGGGKN